MSRIIGASIDLSKIDKSRIKEGKNGAKYYDIVIMVNDQANDYGKDVSIQQGQTKEEREAKTPKVYIGNGKTIYLSDHGATKPASKEDNDNLPF